MVGSGGDRVGIDPMVGERRVSGPEEDQRGQEQEWLSGVDQWGAQGIVAGCQPHAPWMGQGERLLFLPDRRVRIRRFVGILELGTPDAGKMLMASAARRRRLRPPRLLVVYLSLCRM